MNKAAQELGRLGGLAKSAAKTAAVRANGKLGGRPNKMTAESPTPSAPMQRRRKCKICGGLTHPLAMTELGMCQACR